MVRAVFHLYKSLGLPGAGLILMLEGIGIPIPVEIPLSIVGLRMAQGMNSFRAMVLLMWTATVVGNTIGYAIGYYGGRPLALKLLGWFRVKPETWVRMESWFRTHGLKIVVATRWVNWGFAQNMWLCGITRVPFGRFFAVMAFNDFLWAVGWTWVARATMRYVRQGTRLLSLHNSALRVGTAALIVISLVLGIYWFIRWVNRTTHSAPAVGSGPRVKTDSAPDSTLVEK